MSFVFVVTVSQCHRNMGTHISRVKSVRLDNWKVNEVEEMKNVGNEVSNNTYLAGLDGFQNLYVFPSSTDGPFIREQWIRSKYERKEWKKGSNSLQARCLNLSVAHLEDFVVKRGAKRKNWKKRWMVVMGSCCAYYAKRQDNVPKGWFCLKEVSEITVLRDEMEGHPYVIQLSCGEGRPYYLALERPEVLLDWLQLLRYCKSRYIDARAGVRKAADSKSSELLNRALNELVLKSRKFGKKVFDNTFLGSQLIDWLMAVECLMSREDAAAVANAVFLKPKRIKHVLVESSTVIDSFEGYVWVT